jgi:catechol 2,3-dioxygenase
MDIKTKTLAMGVVELNVRDLKVTKEFYETIGLKELDANDNYVTLGSNKQALLRLCEDKELSSPKRTEAGLYHTAFVFADRSHLAKALHQTLTVYASLYQGSADHIVTEAFYFADPEGNGVELYFDKPNADWLYNSDGKPVMGSEYLDEAEYIQKYFNQPVKSAQITVGHVHLKVGDIAQAQKFYQAVLLFDLIIEMPTALFISKDNYHHHLGMNTWESFGAGKRSEKSAGLKSFTINYLDQKFFEQVQQSLKANNIEMRTSEAEIRINDPWGTELILSRK